MGSLKKHAAIVLASAIITLSAAPAAQAAFSWGWPQRPALVSGPSVVAEAPFSDVADSPAKDAFTQLAALGIFRGKEGLFGRAVPGSPVTRAELATVVVRMLNLEALARTLAEFPLRYEDAADIPEWARGYAVVAAQRGIMRGLPGSGEFGRFAADQPVTLKEAVAILVRAVGNEEAVTGGYPSGYLSHAARHGLLAGVRTGPDDVITRELMAQLVANALEMDRWSPDKQRVVPGSSLLNALYGVAEGVVDEADPVRGSLYFRAADVKAPPRSLGSQVFLVGARSIAGLQGKRVRAVVRDGLVTYIKVLGDGE